MVEMRKVVEQNKWWSLGEEFWRYDESFRKLSAFILPRFDIELKPGNIYTIEGMRQIGKTTWIKLKIREMLKSVDAESICYFSCEAAHSRRE